MIVDKDLSILFLLPVLCFLYWHPSACSEVRLAQQRLPCSGEEVIFQCTLPEEAVIWKFPGKEITLARGSRDEVAGNFRAHPIGVVNGSFTSTLTFPAENGTVITCINGIDRSMNSTKRVRVQGPPSAVPTLSCVGLSGEVSETVKGTVSWTLIMSSEDSFDSYLISITTNAPQTPYGGLLNITTASVPQHKLTGFMAGYEYNITVRAVNCGNLEGNESEPLPITPQVPDAPINCTTTAIYNQSSSVLLFINNAWDIVPDPVDPCPDATGNITQYQISFQTGSSVTIESVNTARCTAGRCSHSFEPPSNPPSSYDSVSVAAENVVGVGAARTCTSQPISTTNNVLGVAVVDISSPVDTELQCTFLSGFTGPAHCTVQYGTDPTYMNLPYSAESTETEAAGDSVSVVLRERLNSLTVYYYTVSAVSGDITVKVQGNFTTPQYYCSPMELWHQSANVFSFLPDVSLLEDADEYPSCGDGIIGSVVLKDTTLNIATVAYYNGNATGSRACFVCNNGSGYELNTATNVRVCQTNALWSGSPIVCECRLPLWNIALVVMGVLALLFALVGTIETIIDGIFTCYYLPEEVRKERTTGWTALNVFDAIFLVLGVILWIAVAVIQHFPPNGNACDPTWRSTRDGLFISGFVASILSFILAALVVWIHVYYNYSSKRKTEWHWRNVLLVIAAIFTVTGVGLLIALGVIVYIHCREHKDAKSDGPTRTDKHFPNWIFAIIIVLLFLTVVGIPIAIAMICMKCNKNNEDTHTHTGN